MALPSVYTQVYGQIPEFFQKIQEGQAPSTFTQQHLNFFSKGYISKEQFFDFGLSETIYVDFGLASQAWEYLKLRIHGNKPVYIRGFGRDARGTPLFQSLYRYAYGNQNILKDATNNAEPTKLMREWTGFSKNGGSKYQAIRNYQISHVFGRTKNPYCFTAPLEYRLHTKNHRSIHWS